MKITVSRSSIHDPSASAAIVACGTLGLSANRKSSRRLICGNRASISRRFSRRSARSAISASSSAPRYATGVCCSRRASAASAWKRRRTVGSFSSIACASISASSAAVCALRAGVVIGILRAAGRSRSGPGAGRSCAARRGSRSVSGAGAGLRCVSARRARTATARPSIAPAASAPRTASSTPVGAVLAAEQHDVDHLPGGVRASVALGQRRPQLVEARRATRRGRVPGRARRSAPARRACARAARGSDRAGRWSRTCRAAAHGARPRGRRG